MDKLRIKDGFAVLRPVCVRLTKEHTRDNVRDLRDTLGRLDDNTIQDLQEYILFPLRLLIKQSKLSSVEFYTDVLCCLEEVLHCIKIRDVGVSQDIFNMLCVLVSPPENMQTEMVLSEEIKLATVQCLSTLITKSDSSGGMFLHLTPFLPALGHSVSIILQFIVKEQMRALRIQSMQCLLDFALVKHCSLMTTMIDSGTSFASFLPGVSLSLFEVITAGGNQGQSITCKAIEVWTEIICLVLGDKYLENAMRSSNRVEEIEEKLQRLMISRDSDWVKSTVEKLKILIEKISSTSNHSNWKVRQATVSWASRLLLDCTQSLSTCRSCLLQVLVGAVGDEYSVITKKAITGLEEFKVKLVGPEAKPLLELLQENLHELATALPRLIRTAEDEKKLAILKLVSGYLRLLGRDANSILQSPVQLKRLGQALIQVLELDCSPAKILQDKTDLPILESGCSSKPQKLRRYFKHFHNEKVYQEILAICQLLGTNCDLDSLVDYFTGQLQSNKLFIKQCIIILNEIIDSSHQEDRADIRNVGILENTIRSLIDVYLGTDLWDVPTICSSQEDPLVAVQTQRSWNVLRTTDSKALSLSQINSNIWQICLLLEGMAHFANVLQEDFKLYLMDILYPVLEKLGAESVPVSHTAYLTLLDICQSCQYDSIEHLVYENADYLVNSISLKLRRPTHNVKAPVVLKMMIQHSGPRILPLLQDTLTEILHVLDEQYDESSLLLMRVLYTLVSAVVRWYPPTQSKTGSTQEAVKNETYRNFDDISKFFIEYLKLKDMATGKVSDEDLDTDIDLADSEQCNEELEQDKATQDLPKHVQIVKLILERCIHLLSCDRAKVKLVVLDTIGQSSIALRDHQGELLPLLHRVWPAFVHRFEDEEPVVCLKAFDTLDILSESAGEFLYKRVLTDVLPNLNSVLTKQAIVSCRAGPAYKFTQAYKYQLSVLQKVASLCNQIGLEEEHLDKVMRAVLPYLSARQPRALQQASVAAFNLFCDLDPDAVWLLLNDIYSPVNYDPPDSAFKPIDMAGSNKRNEYTDNILIILSKDVLR